MAMLNNQMVYPISSCTLLEVPPCSQHGPMGRPVWHWWLQQRHRCPAELCCEPQLDAGAGAVFPGNPTINGWVSGKICGKKTIFNIYGYV